MKASNLWETVLFKLSYLTIQNSASMSKRSSNSHFSSSNGSMSYDDESLENLVTRAEQLCFQTPVHNILCRKTVYILKKYGAGYRWYCYFYWCC